jgi:hypothetical protein
MELNASGCCTGTKYNKCKKQTKNKISISGSIMNKLMTGRLCAELGM